MNSTDVLRALKAGSLDRDGVTEPALRAIVELADWLAYPTELGQVPDEIEVVDERTLYWPPASEVVPLTLLRYRVRDTTGFEGDTVGVGLVGSTTASFLGYEIEKRPAEDAYAIHCYWECKRARLLVESYDVAPMHLEEALRSSGMGVDGPSPVVRVTFPRHVERAPLEPVIVVAGERQGTKGWLACDGSRSTWYAASELPERAPATTLAMIHVGRVLLGFETRGIDRSAYQAAAWTLDDDTFLARYERALFSARGASEEQRGQAFEVFGPMARHAGRYARQLTKAGRVDDVQRFLDDLTPHWDSPLGQSELARMAFDATLFERAKHLLEKLRQTDRNHHRSETMGLLARIYAREGNRAGGVALLRDCLSRIDADKATARERATFCEPLMAALRELER